jgi:hypothetical protein
LECGDSSPLFFGLVVFPVTVRLRPLETKKQNKAAMNRRTPK